GSRIDNRSNAIDAEAAAQGRGPVEVSSLDAPDNSGSPGGTGSDRGGSSPGGGIDAGGNSHEGNGDGGHGGGNEASGFAQGGYVA
ncbi:hypothetical protein ABTL90_19545, partial [Acinetobacter baumannii]